MSPQTDETAPVEPSAPTNRKSARKPLNKAYDWAGDTGRAFPRLTNQLRLPQRSDLDDLANPLVVGAIGLVIGVVLGTLMPQMITSSQMPPRGGKRSRRRRG